MALRDFIRGRREPEPQQRSSASAWSDEALDLWLPERLDDYAPRYYSASFAESLPVVIACVGKLSRGVSQMPLQVYDAATDKPIDPRTDEEAHIVGEQWSDRTAAASIERWMRGILLSGKGVVYVERNQDGRVVNGELPLVALHTLDPRWVTRERLLGGQDAEIVYKVNLTGIGVPKITPREDLLYQSFIEARDGVTDREPLRKIWNTVRMAANAAIWAAGFFKDSASPNTVFQADPDFKAPDIIKESKQLWKVQQLMRRLRKSVHVISGKTKPIKLGSNPSEADVENLLVSGLHQVTMIYDVPSLIIGENTNSTFNNVAEAKGEFGDVLIGWANKLAKEISMGLWPMQNRYAKFDTSAAQRAKRIAILAQLVQAAGGPILTANEARAIIDLVRHDSEIADALRETMPVTVNMGGAESSAA